MAHKRISTKLLAGTFGASLFLIGSLGAAENRAYVIQFYTRFDKNADGLLEPKEWKSSRSRDVVAEAIENAGLDPETTVSLKVVIDARLKSSSNSRDKDKPRGYRVKIGQQRLDSDVPEWFRERDGNRDGQVAMAEYAKDWTDKLVGEFLQLDTNRDGVITPEESLEADDEPGDRTSVASASTSRSRYGRSSSSSSKAPSSDETASNEKTDSSEGEKAETGGSPADDTKTTTTAASQGTESAEDIPASYLSYAKSIVKKYDNDGDGALTKDEWSEMSMDPSAADADSDRKITFTEYARWISKK